MDSSDEPSTSSPLSTRQRSPQSQRSPTSQTTLRSRRSPTTPIKKQKIRHEMPKQKIYAQKFNPRWLENPQFKGWLKQHPTNKLLSICEACNAEIKCGKSELEKHAATAKHKKNSIKIKGLQTITSLAKQNTVHMRKVCEAEIKLSNLFAHHNVAFNIVEHLILVLKDCFTDPVLKDIQLGRTKTVNIIKHVIAQKENQDLTKLLQKHFFSVLVDESTDISLNKLFCIVVKYIDEFGLIKEKLLGLITIDAKNCNAENLFANFKECLQSKDIPIGNIIGLASDNASVMIGRNNSFMTRLQAETKVLVVLPCICHSSALVASHACWKLPRTPEEFVRNVASYFSVSPKRTAELAAMQDYFKAELHKMLKLSGTRWLSMQHAVKRVLDNWEILLNYFRVAQLEENSKVVNSIYEQLHNSTTKAILLFLNHILNFFNTFNALFQSKKLLVHELQAESRKIFKNIISHFIKPECIDNFEINLKNPDNFLNLQLIDLGTECNKFISHLPEEIQKSIQQSCLDFLTTAATELQERLPLTDPFFECLNFLKPEIALSIVKPNSVKTLQTVSNKFKTLSYIDTTVIDMEWKKIAIYFSEDSFRKQTFLNFTPQQFWHSLKNLKNFQDEYEFLNVGNLACLCMTLPHSNAETERVFSIVNDVKTKKRNKIGAEALNAVCQTRSSSEEQCCHSFIVHEEHINLMKSKNLYK